VWTIGHSTRTLPDFLDLLRDARIHRLVDVRRYPASRRHPHFGEGRLSRALEEHGVAYRHEPALGGHREPAPDSVNLFWRLPAFRGYADYMGTPEFAPALARLAAEAEAAPTAILCAEADPLRCHRQLVADALVARGMRVRHIVERGVARDHPLHERARIGADGRLTYPGPDGARLF
jgi:uncharacterized protein (DUF488 family)